MAAVDQGATPALEVAPGGDTAAIAQWLKEVEQARRREKDWRKAARDTVTLYEGGKKEEFQYNILYSNTETLAPSLYNATPVPVVQRRFKDDDALGKVASSAVQRTLAYLIDPGESDYSPFDELMKSSVLEGLVAGRGMTRFKYDAELVQVPSADTTQPPAQKVAYETVCGEEVPWDQFVFGYAKKWNKVPWIAFDHFFSRDEWDENFPDVDSTLVQFTEQTGSDDKDDIGNNRDETKGAKLCHVLEIWDKVHKSVLFIAPSCKDRFLKHVPDPLGLKAFFPVPRPLQFCAKISTLVPTTLYSMYEEQDKELNIITLRINKLTAMLKVRGAYDSTVEGMDKILKQADGEMLGLENVAGMNAQGLKLDDAMWLVPIAEVITALQQLYPQREQIKKIIFEITGIADIMRGSTLASETLGAQKLKDQWGTMRLKKMQREVQRYVRDSLRIMGEIAVRKLAPNTLQQMTGLPYPTGLQKSVALEQQQGIQSAMQQPPEALLAVTTSPSWDDILGILKDNITRSYRIDIETNSTVDAEATEDKQNIAELLNAMAQFLAGVSPMVEQGVMPFETAKQMLLAIIRRFRFGPDLEDSLKTMQAPQPKPDPKQAILQQQAQNDNSKALMDLQAKQQDMDNKKQMAAIDMQKAQAQAGHDAQKLQMEHERMLAEHGVTMRELAARQLASERQAKLDEEAHNLKVAQMREAHRIKLTEMRSKPKATQGA